jgi:hypothetical protein
MGHGRLSSPVDGTAGLRPAPEMPCAPRRLRLVPQPDLTSPPTQGQTQAAIDPSSPEFARMFHLIGTLTIEKSTADTAILLYWLDREAAPDRCLKAFAVSRHGWAAKWPDLIKVAEHDGHPPASEAPALFRRIDLVGRGLLQEQRKRLRGRHRGPKRDQRVMSPRAKSGGSGKAFSFSRPDPAPRFPFPQTGTPPAPLPVLT